MKKNLVLLIVVIFLGIVSMNVMAEEVTISLMGWEASPLETENVKEGLELFEKENPNIKIEYTPVTGDYKSKLLTMMAGNAAPDVFFLDASDYRTFQNRGVLLDITDYFNSSFDINDFIPIVQKTILIDDHIYGISASNSSPVLYYNKEIFDEAGLEYPPSNPENAWTWEEFVNVAEKLTITSGNRTTQYGAYGFETTWGWVYPAMIKSNNGEVFNEDYSELLLDSSEAKEVLHDIKELRDIGVAPEGNFLQQSGMSPVQMLQTGRLAMLVDGTWSLQQLANMDFPFGVGLLPKYDRITTVGQSHLHAAWSGTQHPEEAWKLIEFLSSRKYQIQLLQSGLWMSNLNEMHTKEGIKEWITPGVHPEGFEDIIKYSQNAEMWPGILAPQEAWDIVNEELDNYFLDDQPIDEVLNSMENRVQPILKD